MQVMCDQIDPEAAVVMMFYKWHNAPPIQLLSSLDRTADGATVRFSSVHGFPFQATFRLENASANMTLVKLSVTHAIPTLMADWVGVPAFERHVRAILAENCEARICVPLGLLLGGTWGLAFVDSYLRADGPSLLPTRGTLICTRHATLSRCLQVLRLRLAGELAAEDLEDYFDEHRVDFFDGPASGSNAEHAARLPLMEVATERPDGRDEEVKRAAEHILTMQARH